MPETLHGLIFSPPEHANGTPTIGITMSHGDSSHLQEIHLRLSDAGIPSNINRGGRLSPPATLYISGEENIGAFKRHGGIVIEPDALKNIHFSKPRGEQRLQYVPGNEHGLSKVKDILDRLGIKYAPVNEHLEITDPASMCAVAMSGGIFGGSHNFLRECGYTPSR